MAMMSAAMKVMQHQQQLEKHDAVKADATAHAEQLRLMLDAMWASNALDIQTTVTTVCHKVRCIPRTLCSLNRRAVTHGQLR